VADDCSSAKLLLICIIDGETATRQCDAFDRHALVLPSRLMATACFARRPKGTQAYNG
jgi:hypothetical protein